MGGNCLTPPPPCSLPGPEPADAAAYVCQARNEVGGTRSPPLNLDVRFPPQGVQLVPDPSPRVQELTNVTLRCHVTSQPPPRTFEWFREGRPLGRSPKGLWVMGVVTPQASGRYRCPRHQRHRRRRLLRRHPHRLPFHHHHPPKDLLGSWRRVDHRLGVGHPWVLPPPPVEAAGGGR
ncbi:cell adhesion molecule CEACAM6-like [Strix uralensis]|uniref:cell adhesion molecule CEACAM6-like n=1 Tax=Strix uralensis TaxID=36305 RepID=UPI003DA4A649